VLDSTIDRKLHLETSFGRVFDSILDKTRELAVVLGALAGGLIEPLRVIAIVGSTTLFSRRTLSHTRVLKTRLWNVRSSGTIDIHPHRANLANHLGKHRLLRDRGRIRVGVVGANSRLSRQTNQAKRALT
jgi:hypothetical protein